MKRRQMLQLWPAILNAGAVASAPAGKTSTRSEVCEYARGRAELHRSGLAPEADPDEGENGEQTEKS
jgi:hypothetical protein